MVSYRGEFRSLPARRSIDQSREAGIITDLERTEH